jgi:Ca-activated chloride channel homolog
MMKKLRLVTSLILIILAWSNFAIAQDSSDKKKPSNSDKQRSRPIDVKANLIVLDAAGKVVEDLKREDIKVFQDGIEQKISYFEKKEPTLNVCLVIDNTGSMRPHLKNVVLAGLTVVENLGPTDEASVVRFISREKITVERNWTSEKPALRLALQNLYIEGGQSAILDALYLSAEKTIERIKHNDKSRYALILISDGEDRDSYYGFDELIDLVEKTDLQIFVLGFTGELLDGDNENLGMGMGMVITKSKTRSKNLAANLALRTGGAVAFLDRKYTKENFDDALKSILAELRSPYIIGYRPANQAFDNLTRKLRVEIADGPKGEKRQGFVREGYAVPKIVK